MNFDYEILSDPNLSLDFIEENLDKFSKAEFNILCIFNKNITSHFIEKYHFYPWAYYDYQTKLIETRSLYPPDYNEMKKENNKKLLDKVGKYDINTSKESKKDKNKRLHKKIQ
jgi:hypothetical protein